MKHRYFNGYYVKASWFNQLYFFNFNIPFRGQLELVNSFIHIHSILTEKYVDKLEIDIGLWYKQ